MKPISLYAMTVSVLVIIFAMIDYLKKKDYQRRAYEGSRPWDFINNIP